MGCTPKVMPKIKLTERQADTIIMSESEVAVWGK